MFWNRPDVIFEPPVLFELTVVVSLFSLDNALIKVYVNVLPLNKFIVQSSGVFSADKYTEV